jgi:hypothetical protein
MEEPPCSSSQEHTSVHGAAEILVVESVEVLDAGDDPFGPS